LADDDMSQRLRYTEPVAQSCSAKLSSSTMTIGISSLVSMAAEVPVVVESSEGGAGDRDLRGFLYGDGSNRVYRLQNLH